MALSKLGTQFIFGSAVGMRLVQDLQPTVSKVVDLLDAANTIRATSPHTLIVGRRVGPLIDPNVEAANQSDPIQIAQGYLSNLDGFIRGTPAIDAWEGLNEVVGDSHSPDKQAGMAWYARFEVERARLLREQYGKAAVLGNFSTGNPDLPEHDRFLMWRHFLPALEAIRQYDGYLGLHNYRSDNNFTADPQSDIWLMYRYLWPNQFLESLGRPPVRVISTECGADDPPWKKSMSAEQYAEFLIKFELGMRAHPWMVGGTLFATGTFGVWWDYDLDGSTVPDLFVAWARNNPLSSPAPVPSPTPTPVPVPVPIPTPTDVTHRVTAVGLNVRLHPWTGDAEPPKVRVLRQGDPVWSQGTYRGWHCVHADGNEWVNGDYLAPAPRSAPRPGINSE